MVMLYPRRHVDTVDTVTECHFAWTIDHPFVRYWSWGRLCRIIGCWCNWNLCNGNLLLGGRGTCLWPLLPDSSLEIDCSIEWLWEQWVFFGTLWVLFGTLWDDYAGSSDLLMKSGLETSLVGEDTTVKDITPGFKGFLLGGWGTCRGPLLPDAYWVGYKVAWVSSLS